MDRSVIIVPVLLASSAAPPARSPVLRFTRRPRSTNVWLGEPCTCGGGAPTTGVERLPAVEPGECPLARRIAVR
jgi:hypothetical protein